MCSTCISFVKRQMIRLKSSFCFRLMLLNSYWIAFKKSFNQWYWFLSMVPLNRNRRCHLIFRSEFLAKLHTETLVHTKRNFYMKFISFALQCETFVRQVLKRFLIGRVSRWLNLLHYWTRKFWNNIPRYKIIF